MAPFRVALFFSKTAGSPSILGPKAARCLAASAMAALFNVKNTSESQLLQPKLNESCGDVRMVFFGP